MTPETPTPDYGEPWHTDSANGVMAKTDEVICYPFHFVAPEVALADRIISCVNACVGMADLAAEIAAMREAIQEAYAALDACSHNLDSAYGKLSDNADAALAKLQPFLKP